MLKRDERGRCVHINRGITTETVWVKENGYQLEVSFSPCRFDTEKKYIATARWGYTKVNGKYTKSYCSNWDDITFKTYEGAWNWLNAIADGRLDADKILNDYIEKTKREADERREAERASSAGHLENFTSALKAHNMTLEEFEDMLNDYNNISCEDLENWSKSN